MRSLPLLLALALAGCASSGDSSHAQDDAGKVVLTPVDASFPSLDATTNDATTTRADAAEGRCATGSDRFIKQVISFKPGGCAGFGEDVMPDVVCGPPEGAGDEQGSTDVVSLGNGGEIVVGFGENGIKDGPGDDFIVFENPFLIGGNPNNVYAEPGEVSVSEDGVHWSVFPCTDTSTSSTDYGECAGVHPVLSDDIDGGNGISPFDVSKAGGDPYDLATLGVSHAKYVRIRDVVIEACWDAGTEAGAPPTKNGFDLDAIAIVNPLLP